MYTTFLSRLLDEMQEKYRKAENEYQRKILRRIIELLETYVK